MRVLALGIAAALLWGGSAQAAEANLKDEAEFKAAMARLEPVLLAQGVLMHMIGYCEPYIEKSSVDFYLREYGKAPDGGSNTGVAKMIERSFYALNSDAYIEGRQYASQVPPTRDGCQRLLNDALSDIKKLPPPN